jgi:hypothetical protein
MHCSTRAKEKEIYEAIDGRRTIGQIVDAVESSGPGAQDFFQKLWRYDQVVFGTSAVNTQARPAPGDAGPQQKSALFLWRQITNEVKTSQCSRWNS